MDKLKSVSKRRPVTKVDRTGPNLRQRVQRRGSETEIGDVCLDMKVRMKNPRVVRGACLACCLVVLTTGSWAATAPIYKCLDKDLGLLYTDEPCKEGEQLNIRPGDADPAAVARLERQRDALDQSASQRIADLRRAATEGEAVPRLRYEALDERRSYDYGSAYVADYGIVSRRSMHRHAMRPREPKPLMRHFAPPPPYFVPRR